MISEKYSILNQSRSIEYILSHFQSVLSGNRFLGRASEFICVLIKTTTSNPNAIYNFTDN